MEARVAVLEEIARSTAASLERIERTTAASLERIERRLETGLAHADGRMDRLDDRMGRIDSRMDRIDQRLDMLWGAQRSDFRWLLGMMVAGTGTTLASMLGLLGVMAHGFHWL